MTHVPEQRRLSLVMAAAILAAVAGAAPAAVAAPNAGTTPDARGVLASLDDQEREALHRMATLEMGGLHVKDEVLESADPVDVIVQLRTPPARTARLLAAAEGRLHEVDPPRWKPGAAVAVVMASRGYPETSSKGDHVVGVETLDEEADVDAIHAGTAIDDQGRLVHDIDAVADEFHMVTGVREHDGQVWLGSLHEPALAVLSLVPVGD